MSSFDYNTSSEYDDSDNMCIILDDKDSVMVKLYFDYNLHQHSLHVRDVQKCFRNYTEQFMVFFNGSLTIKPIHNCIKIVFDNVYDKIEIEFTRNDIINATLCDFVNGKNSSRVAFGTNQLYSVDTIDDMDNPLFCRVRLINGIYVLDRIGIIFNDI